MDHKNIGLTRIGDHGFRDRVDCLDQIDSAIQQMDRERFSGKWQGLVLTAGYPDQTRYVIFEWWISQDAKDYYGDGIL